MYISYFDESGDDGYPKYSSELFVLCSMYMHETFWKDNYQRIHEFRKSLKTEYGFPIKEEFHTKEFITNKNPYHGKYETEKRRRILKLFCQLIANLNVKCVITVIDKTRISRSNYDVMKNALTYNVQRIENDLNHKTSADRFLIISDEGRLSKMRETTRLIQKYNPTPNSFGNGYLNKTIQLLIEDPLPKNSKESYFIQLVDVLAFVASLYVKKNMCNPIVEWGNRVSEVLKIGDELELMEILKPSLNLSASRKNVYGIVFYPK